MDTIEGITPAEEKAIEELRSRMKGSMNPELASDDFLFYRFLKARDFNIDQSEEMLRKHLEWRKENRVDSILTEYQPSEVIEKYFNPSFVGFDKEGCLIRYCPAGNMDIKGLAKSATIEEMLRSIIYMMESDLKILEEQSKKLGRRISRLLYIYDLDKGTISKATNKKMTQLMLKVIQLNQDNYPERTKAIYVINAPIFFPMLFSILKVFMAGALLEKIKVFGTSGWKNVLLEDIDPDVLPAFLGGERTDLDGNPMCNTFINHGSLVPEKYYMNTGSRLSSLPDTQKITVLNSSKVEVPFEISKAGCFIEWEFETVDHDIGFGLFRKTDSDHLEELVPVERVDASTETETGLYKCQEQGTYVVTFDNTYSWLRSKIVYYRVSVRYEDEVNGKNTNNATNS